MQDKKSFCAQTFFKCLTLCVCFSLQKQQSHLKELLDQSSENNKKVKAKEEEIAQKLQQKTQQEGNLVEQLKRIVSEKEQKVHQLEEEIQEIKTKVSNFF